MKAAYIEKYVEGFNARVNGANKAPNRTYGTQDGYRNANTLFNKETALIIRESRLPNYPKAISAADVVSSKEESANWTDTCMNMVGK